VVPFSCDPAPAESAHRENRPDLRNEAPTMAYDARALANLLLDLADDLGLRLTHMAIHKIIFYAHGWYLAETNEPLVRQAFEAWDYGPVLKPVYEALRPSGKKPVAIRATHFDPVSGNTRVVSANFASSDVSFVRNVLRAYGHLDALELSHLTHRSGSPWDQVWNAPGGKITLGMTISNDAIREDFLHHRSPLVADDRRAQIRP
jgi:uncharacterized phage-associated protein